jgi:hypothetical protein
MSGQFFGLVADYGGSDSEESDEDVTASTVNKAKTSDLNACTTEDNETVSEGNDAVFFS